MKFIIRKLDVDNLPKWKSGNNKNQINWKECIGHKVKFIYDDINGELLITDYLKNYITVKYNNSFHKIFSVSFLECKLGNIIGTKTSSYKYEIGEIIYNLNSGELRILNRMRRMIGGSLYKHYEYDCLVCGNKDFISEYNINNKKGCNVCCIPSKKVLVGYNDMWSTVPQVAVLLLNKKDGYEHSKGSNKRVNWVCSNCGFVIKNKMINNVVENGLCCPKCSDGISYPEKFVINVLSQLHIDFEFQKSFKWSLDKKYDIFIPSVKAIIEVHGEQHYKYTGRGRSLREEQVNDIIKKEMASENGIDKYICINCSISNMEYIKYNIINSHISTMFNLSNINWRECHNYATSSFAKRTCDLWNSGKTSKEIKNELKIHGCTVTRYLRQGAVMGWCEYDKKRSIMRNKNWESSKIPIVKCDIDSSYIGEYESISDACRALGLHTSLVTKVLKGKRKTTGGFKWMYKSDYDKLISANEVTTNSQ